MANHRRHNSINLVHVDGFRVEGVQSIRTAVYNHFSNHFKASGAVRPGVEGLQFRKLSYCDAGKLTKSFSLNEVKQYV